MGSAHRVAIVTVLTAAAAVAAGDPTADRLFREGRALMKEGQLAEACAQFEDSQRLEPSVGTMLNLGDCRERIGQLANAWATFRAAHDLAAQRHDRRGGEADRRADKLEPRLAYLTTEVRSPPAALVVQRDGAVIDAAMWDHVVPLDPRDYTITAAAPGYRPWSASVELRAGQRAVVTVELVADPPSPAPAVVAVIGPPPRPVSTGTAPTTLPLRQLGVGLAIGANQREVPIAGVRLVAGVPFPGGALRGTGSVSYSSYDDAALDPIEHTTTISVAVGGDYLWTPLPQLALAAGIGIGFDRDQTRRGGMISTDTGAWWMVHASPLIVRVLGGHLEVGLHVQVARAGNEWTTIVLTAADVLVR